MIYYQRYIKLLLSVWRGGCIFTWGVRGENIITAEIKLYPDTNGVRYFKNPGMLMFISHLPCLHLLMGAVYFDNGASRT